MKIKRFIAIIILSIGLISFDTNAQQNDPLTERCLQGCRDYADFISLYCSNHPNHEVCPMDWLTAYYSCLMNSNGCN